MSIKTDHFNFIFQCNTQSYMLYENVRTNLKNYLLSTHDQIAHISFDTCNSLTGINSNLIVNAIDNIVIMYCLVQNEDS